MDRISKKTHFLKSTFHIFQIPSSIFILFYFKQFPPKLLVFSSKSSPTPWCKKKPKPRQWAEWCAHWPRPTWLEGLPSPTNQTNWIPPTIRWVSPGKFQQTEEKTQKHPKRFFVSIFLRFSDDVFHWKKVRKTNMFHKPTKKHFITAVRFCSPTYPSQKKEFQYRVPIWKSLNIQPFLFTFQMQSKSGVPPWELTSFPF